MYPPKPKTSAELRLIKDNDELRTELVRLRRELTNKEGYAGRLEVLLRERMEQLDELNAKVEQLRERIKRLDEENERLAQIVGAGGAVARPQRDAAIVADAPDLRSQQ